MGLCVAGVAAFAYDRIQPTPGLAAPQQAFASALSAETPVPAPAQAVAALPNNLSPDLCIGSHKVFAQRLETIMKGDFPPTDDIRDAFYAAGLQPPPAVVLTAAPVLAAPTIQDTPRKEVFAQGHQLRAVLVGSAGRMALMDNTCLKIGQKLEEFELVGVGERSASFTSGKGDHVTFTLPVKPDGQ